MKFEIMISRIANTVILPAEEEEPNLILTLEQNARISYTSMDLHMQGDIDDVPGYLYPSHTATAC